MGLVILFWVVTGDKSPAYCLSSLRDLEGEVVFSAAGRMENRRPVYWRYQFHEKRRIEALRDTRLRERPRGEGGNSVGGGGRLNPMGREESVLMLVSAPFETGTFSLWLENGCARE